MLRMNFIRRPLLAIAQPIQTRFLGYQFRTDETMFRDFAQLKFNKKNQTPELFDLSCMQFSKQYMPDTEGNSFGEIRKYVKRIEQENSETPDDTPEVFVSDVEMLAKAFKAQQNPYQLYAKQMSGKIRVPEGKRYIQVVAESYKKLNDAQKKKLMTDAVREYSVQYRQMSSKYAKQKLVVPQFLNPYNQNDAISEADRKLWTQVYKEHKNNKTTASLAKQGKSLKAEESRALRNELRAKYGFCKDYTFRQNPHMILLMRQKEINPGMMLRDVMKDLGKVKKSMTKAQLASIEKESKKLKDQFDAQNKVAAVKAIAAEDWQALKRSEVEAYGTKEEVKAYGKAKRDAKKANMAGVEGLKGADFNVFKQKQMAIIRAEARGKYAFHENLTFSDSAYFLYMKQEGKSVKDMVAGANWQSNISKAQLAKLEKQSMTLKAEFNAKNKAAALSAIKKSDWLALQMVEVKLHGSKDDLKAFNKARKNLEMKLAAEFTQQV